MEIKCSTEICSYPIVHNKVMSTSLSMPQVSMFLLLKLQTSSVNYHAYSLPCVMVTTEQSKQIKQGSAVSCGLTSTLLWIVSLLQVFCDLSRLKPSQQLLLSRYMFRKSSHIATFHNPHNLCHLLH